MIFAASMSHFFVFLFRYLAIIAEYEIEKTRKVSLCSFFLYLCLVKIMISLFIISINYYINLWTNIISVLGLSLYNNSAIRLSSWDANYFFVFKIPEQNRKQGWRSFFVAELPKLIVSPLHYIANI